MHGRANTAPITLAATMLLPAATTNTSNERNGLVPTILETTHVGAEVAEGHGCHPLHRMIFRPNQRHEDVQRPLLQDRIAVLQVRRKVSKRPRGFPRNQG